MNKKDEFRFLTDEERGIDPTQMMANDCNRIQNAPIAGAIPHDGGLMRRWMRVILLLRPC